MPHLPRIASVAFLLAAIALTAPMGGCEPGKPASTAAAPAVTPAPLTLGDAAVIGASVSAGCEATLPGFRTASLLEPHGHCTLASVLGVATNSTAPSGEGDTMFFLDPAGVAKEQIEAARKVNPKILFAVDFLFWHCYGDRLDAAGRLARLDEGLAALDSFTCPIVVGDIPDMSHTALISKSQRPDAQTLTAANERITAWAATRPRVVVIPLFTTVGKAIKSEPVAFGGNNYDGPASRQLLTLSGLHVTPEGLIALALECITRLHEQKLIASHLTWETDRAKILKQLVDAKTAAEQKKKAPAAPKPG